MSIGTESPSIPDVSNPFQAFQDLMPFRVQDILLVSSLYDSFTLQEDGRLRLLVVVGLSHSLHVDAEREHLGREL